MAGTMTCRERMEAAIALKKPDRVPLAPLILQFAGRYGGITGEEYLFDRQKAVAAVERTFNELGGWDAWPLFNPIEGKALTMRAVRYRFPGRDLPSDSSYQVIEEPFMTIEDYDTIINEGYGAFYKRFYRKVYPEYDPAELPVMRDSFREFQKKCIATWAERGIPTIAGAMINLPFDELAQYRSMKELALDIHRRPEKVKAAIDAATPIMAETGKRGAMGSGALGVWVGGLRSNSSFISNKHFEQLVLPSLISIVGTLVEAGLVVLLHFDQDWTLNLPYLRELPAGKCILATDGKTDIFQAKKLLGDRFCLMGDVPSTLLSLGSPPEVEAYCRRLIEEVGAGGGFILSSGCELPVDAKPENVRAMIAAVQKYGQYR